MAVKKSEANTKYSDYGCLIVYVDKALVESNLTTSQMLARRRQSHEHPHQHELGKLIDIFLMHNLFRRLDLQHETTTDMSASNFEKQVGKEFSTNLIPWLATVPDTAPYYCLQVDNIYIYTYFLSLKLKEKIYKTEYILVNHTFTNVQLSPSM